MRLRGHGRPFGWILTGFGIATIVAELACRYLLGLGEPVLYIRDDNCGYRFAPSQNLRRFGNRVTYDEASCRGGMPAPSRQDAWTTLVVGDSVVDGLALTDDMNVAGGVLNDMAVDRDGHRLIFRTLAAGSWGTPQQLGYLKAYGWLGANACVLVLNSGDTVTRAVRTDPIYPTRKSWTAAEELLLRYALRRRSHLFGPRDWGSVARAAEVPPEMAQSADDTALGAWCLAEILRLGRDRSVPVGIVVWPGRDEATLGSWGPEVKAIREVAEPAGVPLISLMDKVRERPGFQRQLYRDDIHPSERGHRLIAGAILQLTQAFLEQESPAPE